MGEASMNRAGPTTTAHDLVAHLPTICTVEETAEALRCSVRQVKRWIAVGDLETIKLTRYVQVPRASIERLLDASMARPRTLRRVRRG
jgi:Helix-turn-helix domain